MWRVVRVTAIVAGLCGTPAFSPVTGQEAARPNANAILARVKAGLRTHERPPYVVYTLVRHQLLDGVPHLSSSYTLRIWCRTIDSAALSRRASGSHTTGNAEFIRPAFDKPIDPG